MKDLDKLKKWAKDRVDEAAHMCLVYGADEIWHREWKAEIDSAGDEERVHDVISRLEMDLSERLRRAEMREYERC